MNPRGRHRIAAAAFALVPLAFGLVVNHTRPEPAPRLDDRRASDLDRLPAATTAPLIGTLTGAILLLLLTALAALATVAGVQPVRELLVLLAMLLVPGGTIMLRIGRGRDVIATLGVTVVLSLAVDVCVGLAMAWTGVWDPMIAGAVVAVVCAGSIALSARTELSAHPRRGGGVLDRLRRHPRAEVHRLRLRITAQGLLAMAPIPLALLLWAFSLDTADLSRLSVLGTPTGIPPTFYLSLVVVLAGAVAAIAIGRPNGWVITAYLIAVLVIMFGWLPAVSVEPPYSYLYKHVGVVQLIQRTGMVHPSVDIYNRWPGFFAAAATFAKLSGYGNPLHFVAWAQPMFAALDTLLVVACARIFSRDVRFIGWTALLYAVTNYCDQNYFSPQAMAFALSLGVLLIVLDQLTDLRRLHPKVASLATRIPVGRAAPAPRQARRPGRVPAALTRLVRLRDRRGSGRGHRALADLGPLQRRWVLPAVLLLQMGVVYTHQLSPYILVFQIGALTLLGLVRPRWLVVAMAAMTVTYLLPNFAWVRTHYAVFASLDPIHNGLVPIAGHEPWLAQHCDGLLGWVLSGAALVGAVRLLRLGHIRGVTALAALVIAPYVILTSQSYGGEAVVRVALFTSPWRVILVAWALSTISRRGVRLGIGLLTVAPLAGLWLPAFFSTTPVAVVPPAEVQASRYFYRHASAGSTLIEAAADFPVALGSRYALMGGTTGLTLTYDRKLVGRRLGRGQLHEVIAFMRSYAASGPQYLVFSPTETRYAATQGQLTTSSMAALQGAVASSRHFRLWYADGPTRIYELRRTHGRQGTQ